MRKRGPSVFIAVLAASLTGSGNHSAWAAKNGPLAETVPAVAWRDLASPAPLTAAEEANPAAAALARRFNPAMAFGHRDIWPVSLRYSWADGSNLTAAVVDDQGKTLREYEALTNDRLANDDWGDLPTTDSEGNRIRYSVDAPGDDRSERGVSFWRRRWRAIMGGEPLDRTTPAGLQYAPTQHAHLFWLNREMGLLAIQYWFYFPYNEWINHHEGDWEHINVIVRGSSRLTNDNGWRPVGYQFFFHEFVTEPKQVVRVGGSDPREDHVVVYTGGRSRFLRWSGLQSGGSYPLPGSFENVGGGITGLRASEDVANPERFIRPEDFDVVVLPEPERLDVGLRPELTWLRLDFFAGQAHMYENPLSMNGMTFGTVPRQPARQGTWNGQWSPLVWQGESHVADTAVMLPKGWRALVTPLNEAPTSLLARPGKRRPVSHSR
jgi:hypothetical protein